MFLQKRMESRPADDTVPEKWAKKMSYQDDSRPSLHELALAYRVLQPMFWAKSTLTITLYGYIVLPQSQIRAWWHLNLTELLLLFLLPLHAVCSEAGHVVPILADPGTTAARGIFIFHYFW